jgi:hypothetical protein
MDRENTCYADTRTGLLFGEGKMKKLLGLLLVLTNVFFVYSHEFERNELAKAIEKIVSFNINMYGDSFVWEDGRSSALVEDNKPADKYEITKISDNDCSTAWVEGKPDDGINEWVIIPVKDEEDENMEDAIWKYKEGKTDSITVEFTVNNGYQASEDLYKKNNRVKEAEISIYAVPYTVGMNSAHLTANPDLVFEKTVTFSDEIIFNPIYINYSSFEFTFDLPEKYRTDDDYRFFELYLKVEIKSVYKGTKYSDTCISEMSAKTIH